MEQLVLALYVFLGLMTVSLIAGGYAIYHYGERPKLRALARAQARAGRASAPR